MGLKVAKKLVRYEGVRELEAGDFETGFYFCRQFLKECLTIKNFLLVTGLEPQLSLKFYFDLKTFPELLF